MPVKVVGPEPEPSKLLFHGHDQETPLTSDTKVKSEPPSTSSTPKKKYHPNPDEEVYLMQTPKVQSRSKAKVTNILAEDLPYTDEKPLNVKQQTLSAAKTHSLRFTVTDAASDYDSYAPNRQQPAQNVANRARPGRGRVPAGGVPNRVPRRRAGPGRGAVPNRGALGRAVPGRGVPARGGIPRGVPGRGGAVPGQNLRGNPQPPNPPPNLPPNPLPNPPLIYPQIPHLQIQEVLEDQVAKEDQVDRDHQDQMAPLLIWYHKGE